MEKGIKLWEYFIVEKKMKNWMNILVIQNEKKNWMFFFISGKQKPLCLRITS